MKINNLEIKWFGQSGFLLEAEGKAVYIDPYNLSVSGEAADLILITHPHYDHCSMEDIQKIVKDGTVIVCPADCQSKIARIDKKVKLKIMQAGETVELDELGIKIGAVPAYNKDKEYHSRSEGWLGYVVKIGESVVYHAGDTDLIPEMEKLQGKVQVALLPVGGTYTMDSGEAAEAAAIIKPEIAVPMHYGEVVGTEADAQNFKKLCEDKGIKVEVLGEG